MTSIPSRARRLISEVQADGVIALRIEQATIPALSAGELLVRVEAAPLHPSDLAMLLVSGDLARAERAGSGDSATLRLPVPAAARAMLAARAGIAMPVGNEGGGIVVAAGDAAGEALIGRSVGIFGGGTYADYRVVPRDRLAPLPEGASPRDGAAIWVNPLTALAMVETMEHVGAKAIVNTAAASSLGQILQRLCAQDGIPLVNIVRRPEQAAILRALGAVHVLDSQSPAFMAAMIEAFAAVQATIAFDAVGGGPLAGMMLAAMESAQKRGAPAVSPYGSPIPKRVYVYGRLDLAPTAIPPTVGMAWSVGGFLLPHFLENAGKDVERRLIDRVMRDLTTTFAIAYTEEIGLAGLLDPDVLARASAKATSAKFLIRPNG